MWALDTVVTAATVGRLISARAAISPGRLDPSSSATARCWGESWSRVSGSPHWLLKLDWGLRTGPRVSSTAAIISFVVVLPLEPVTAATGMVKRARWQAASRPSARVVSSTRTTGTLEGRSSGSACTTRQEAPRAAASWTNAWPSCCQPRMAKNTSPTRRLRLSMDTPEAWRPRSPPTSAPWVPRTTSSIVNIRARVLMMSAPRGSPGPRPDRRREAPESQRSGRSRGPCRRSRPRRRPGPTRAHRGWRPSCPES